MSRDPLPRAEVLALQTGGRSLDTLLAGLVRRGIRVDRAAGLVALTNCFTRSGGHDALLLAPDLPRILAARAVARITAVDPRILVVSFAHEFPDFPGRRVLRLHSLHPSSPAACGSVFRALLLRAVL